MKKDQVLRQLDSMKNSLHVMNKAIDSRRALTIDYEDADKVTTAFAHKLIDLNRDLALLAIKMEEEL